MELSFGEIVLVGVISILVLGPKDLFRYAHYVGKSLGRFRSYANNLRVMAEEEYLKDDEPTTRS